MEGHIADRLRAGKLVEGEEFGWDRYVRLAGARCSDFHCEEDAIGSLMSPRGRLIPGPSICRGCADSCIAEYRDILGEEWSIVVGTLVTDLGADHYAIIGTDHGRGGGGFEPAADQDAAYAMWRAQLTLEEARRHAREESAKPPRSAKPPPRRTGAAAVSASPVTTTSASPAPEREDAEMLITPATYPEPGDRIDIDGTIFIADAHGQPGPLACEPCDAGGTIVPATVNVRLRCAVAHVEDGIVHACDACAGRIDRETGDIVAP